MIEIIVAFIKNLSFLFISTEVTPTIQQADDVQLHAEPDLIAKDRENQDTLEYEKEYEDETFLNEEEEDENAHENHEDEYENDSFIIDDNGGTGDGDLTSSSVSSLSGQGYQSQDEVSN